MDDGRKVHWRVRFFPSAGGNKSPQDFINEIDRDDQRAAIYRRLRTIELIKIPREWPETKLINYEGYSFYQIRIGNHRLFVHLDTDQGRADAVICHACLKRSGKAKPQDLNRVVINIKKYLS